MPDAIDSFLGEAPPDQLQQAAPGMDELTRQAVVTAHEALMRNAAQPPISEEGQRMGIRPGVAFEANQGVPKATRFQLGLDRNKLNQFKVLARKYGAENVNVTDDGRFVLQNQIDPASGIKHDVLVDPIGVDAGDISEEAAQLLPLTAGVIGARLGIKAPGGALAKTLGGITFGALSQRAAEGQQQGIARLIRGDELNLGEITKERAKDATADELLGLTFAGGGRLLRLASPFSSVSAETMRANVARERLNKTLVNQLPETPGLRTGSKFLLRSEAQAREVPGTAGVFDEINKSEQAAVDELRRISLGVPRTLTDDELRAALPQADVVGQKSLARLGNESLKVEGAVESARQNVGRTGTVEAQLKGGALVASPVNTTDLGREISTSTRTQWDAMHDKYRQAYGDFFSKPETTELVVDADALGRLTKQLRKDFIPLAAKTKSVPSGIVDASGNPINVDKTSIDELDKFVQTRVLSALDELEGLTGAKTSIRSLKQIRTNIDDAIAQNVAIPGTDVGQLKKIRGEVSDFIRGSLAKMDDKTLLNEWDALNAGYKKDISRFDWNSIRDMLIKPGQPGSPGETQIAERVLGKSAGAMDAWHAYGQFFGSNSPEMTSLKQAVRSKTIGGAFDKATGSITGSKLAANLEDLRPEIAEEVFGVNQQQLREIAGALSTSQGKYDIGELMNLANSKTLTAKAVYALGVAEDNRARTYSNAMINAARKGNLGPEAIQPSEFVRYMTNGKLKIDPDDIHLIKNVLSDDPALVQQIDQLAVEDFFSRAGLSATGGKRVLAQGIDDTIGDEVQQRRWSALFGQNTLNSLKDLADAVRPGSVAAQSFRSAGRLSSGSITARILGGSFEGVPEIAKRMVLGKLYANRVTRGLIANNLMDNATTLRAINAMITSEPFVTETLRRFGPDASRDVMGGLRKMVDNLYARQKSESQFPVMPEAVDKFLGEPQPQP